VTTPSQYLKGATYDKLNVSTDFPVEVIGNFVDTEEYQPGNDGIKTKLSPCFKDSACDGPVLTHVSNFRAVKRIPDIIEVFARVNAEVPSKLILIGDGPERGNAERLVFEKKLTDKVCFLGKLETFTEILQGTTVFLLPSESESFGLAALEAQSCGIPVVASNAGGIPEVVIDGETGFLSDIGDVQDMAKNVLKIINDSALAKKLGENARKRVLDNFSYDKLIEEYEKYYLYTLSK
jgi:N-acetyl-alpha-D-glucosaminyl L-malate synthase BshA